MASDPPAPDSFVASVDERATELMRRDPVLYGWLVALGADHTAATTDGTETIRADEGAAPAPEPPAVVTGGQEAIIVHLSHNPPPPNLVYVPVRVCRRCGGR